MLPPRSALTCLSQYGICFSRFCFSVRSQVSHQFWLFWLLQLSFQLRARHFFRRSGSLKPQGTHLKMSEAASPPVKRGRGRPRKSNPDGEVPPPIVIPATQEGTKMRKKANRSGFTPTEIEDLPEKRIRKLKIKSFPNEDEDSEPRSAFSIPRRSDSTEPSSSKKNPVRKTTRKAAKRAAKSLREAPVVERALTSKNTAEDSEDGSMEGKRRRKRKILDWTPSGPKECEEVPSNDEDDDDGDYEPEQDEEKESDGERHEPPVQPPTDGRPRRGRPSNAMLAARQARTASVVGVTPGRSNKPKVKFDALPLLQVAVDGTSDPEDYEEENNAAGGDDGLVHLKFDKETRTIDNYGCYLSQYGNIKKSANGLTGDPMECNQPPLAMKSWMSRYAIVPGQSVLAKIM
ncbi:hypothetical protein L596_026269 [Steinernema carpocapsae]|uniref:Uncharacterized protein n=1 Tax=Steinernema carpocapsae TaxID=34508 RepID=A0A4U5M0U9_STECR|nr:hypothetical protein L596_026269 [Steinernema carpocapsae]